MTDQRNKKLHPATCFPANPSIVTIRNRLFLRIASKKDQHTCSQLTFIGINSTTYSAIAALLASRPTASIECINLFDACKKSRPCAILKDLQLIAVFNKTNIRLRWTQSYWETKNSTIIIINVQHHQLDNESTATWTQMNALLVEDIVSQVCSYSPNATLIICTQPNELMTYVARRTSGFPSERVFGLGASVETAYAHREILNRMENIYGHVNGYWILSNGGTSKSCATVITDHLTIDGIACSDIQSKLTNNQMKKTIIENLSLVSTRKVKQWNLVKTLESDAILCSDISRRSPIISDLVSRQKTAMKYLSSNLAVSRSKLKTQQTIPISLPSKARSNWTEAMLITHLVRAVINNHEFKSNFAVNIGPISNSHEIFANYPSIIGSQPGTVKYMLPFRSAQDLLQQNPSLISLEKSQRKLRLLKSKD